MPRRMQIVAVVLFVIVDVIAVVWVVRQANDRPTGTSLVAPTVEPSEKQLRTDPAGIAVSGTVVARFGSGACDDLGSAWLGISSDGANSFNEITLPLEKNTSASDDRAAALTAILSVQLDSATEFAVIGKDAECNDVRYTTDSAGDDWEREEAVAEWYVVDDAVVAPQGPSEAGCAVLSVWPVSALNARVGCDNDQIRGTNDGGATWVGLGQLEGLSAVVFTGIRSGFAIADEPDCASQVYSTQNAGGGWQLLACVDRDFPTFAIAGSDELLAAIVDGAVAVSLDQGVTWSTRGATR